VESSQVYDPDACGKLGQIPPALPLPSSALSSRHGHATLANHHALYAAIS
jgi:hypothetical protein